MALSEAKKAADKRHISKLDNIMVRPYLEEGAAIRASAAAAGKSVQGYVLEAVRAKMEQERDGTVPAGAGSPSAGAGGAPSAGGAPAEEAGDGFGFSAGSPEQNICSRFTSQWGPDFQTALSITGQSAEEFVEQAIKERIEREITGN